MCTSGGTRYEGVKGTVGRYEAVLDPFGQHGDTGWLEIAVSGKDPVWRRYGIVEDTVEKCKTNNTKIIK